MTRVLIDGRIRGHDGIGRYTTFAERFGEAALAELRTTTELLRGLVDLPVAASVPPGGTHAQFYAGMLALACTRATAIVAATSVVAAQVASMIRPGAPITVAPWGIDHLRLLPHPLRSPVAGPYLLYVGQARSHKGLETLLAAHERSTAAAAGVPLVLVGRDFADGQPGTRIVGGRVGDAVRLVGSVDDATLDALYAGAEALVHLAEYEGFGFPPLEALAAGTRVIASDIPALRETLGEYGIFVNHLDPAAVARTIDEVLANRDDPAQRRSRLAWAGRYRWARHANQVLSLYGRATR